ncbi:HPr(Ser) kinase/phosphatase [Myxococcota bacterium]|nr:HPr(Ser) kinase/phosphatase [Myxococcota bacterium]
MKVGVQALLDDEDFGLDLTLLAGEQGLESELNNPRVQKCGLALAGFLKSVEEGRVQILGQTELDYLESLEDEEKSKRLQEFLESRPTCIVFTNDMFLPEACKIAEGLNVPVFSTTHRSSTFITRVQDLLDEHLSPETTLHAVLIDVFGVGVLLRGPSGIGKSECALDLILRGHRLVADDTVIVRRIHQELRGSGSSLTRHHMEVRGLGIINVKDLYGAASVRERKRLELVMELVEWENAGECDRTGLDETYYEVMGVKVVKASVPIRPGRDVATIVEVAARNYLLRQQGHNAALQLQEKLESRLAEVQRRREDKS